MASHIRYKKPLTNVRQPNGKDTKRHNDPTGIDPQEAPLMSAHTRQSHPQTKRARLRPHTQWAEKLIALAQCQLSDAEHAHVEAHLSDAEREQIQAHLRECPTCTEVYRAYRGVYVLLHNINPPDMAAGLSSKQQARKKRLADEDAQFTRQQRLREITEGQPQKKPTASKGKPRKTPAAESAQDGGAQPAHPAAAKN